jgi:hypothetical protein
MLTSANFQARYCSMRWIFHPNASLSPFSLPLAFVPSSFRIVTPWDPFLLHPASNHLFAGIRTST